MLFLAVHTPARFATIQLNFGVVLDYHEFFERRTSPEMMMRSSLVACTLDLGLRDTHTVYALGVPARGYSCPLMPPHFSICPTLAVDSFIDIVGQNWPRNAGLPTPLQLTVIQPSLPPRWPQQSQIAWLNRKSFVY